MFAVISPYLLYDLMLPNFPQYTHIYISKVFQVGTCCFPRPHHSPYYLSSVISNLFLSTCPSLLCGRAEIQVQGCLSPALFSLISAPSQGISGSDDLILIEGFSWNSSYHSSCSTAYLSILNAIQFRSHLYVSGSKWFELLEIWVWGAELKMKSSEDSNEDKNPILCS